MKKMRPLPLFIVLAFIGGLLYSCSKEETNITQDNQKNLKAQLVYTDCETQCIVEGSGDFYAKTDQHVVTYGSDKSPKVKVVDVMYYNTETHFVLKVKSTEGFSDLVVGGISQGIKADENVWGTYTFPLAEGWQACDNINFSLQVAGGGGPQGVFTIDYNLIGICPSCEESFVYNQKEDGSYTFTYTPAEDLTDVLVVFTFAQGVAVEGLVDWTTNGQTRQKTMSFEKCVPVSWTVTLQADCNGKQKESNVWTDFKIGDVSKKGELATITMVCPE